jgi:hypothetical protein
MINRKRTGIVVLVLAFAVASLEVGAALSVPGFHSVAGAAQARVGRPLTPVSVAGVGRRTVRRCAVGVYDC